MRALGCAKDGYAVRSNEGAGVFPVAAAVTAGTEAPSLPAGHVAYITTGAAVPDGADSVQMVRAGLVASDVT